MIPAPAIPGDESAVSPYGKYPDRLNQIEPQFIAEIPAKARIAFTDSGFRYFAGSSHTLMYVAIPPFGRKTYNFETKSWGFMD